MADRPAGNPARKTQVGNQQWGHLGQTVGPAEAGGTVSGENGHVYLKCQGQQRSGCPGSRSRCPFSWYGQTSPLSGAGVIQTDI